MKARITLIGTLVVLIAVLAPATAAAKSYIDRATSQTQQVRPDDRAGARGVDGSPATSVAVRPDDRGGILGPGTAPSTTVVQSSNSFDWRDAFIGSLGGLGIAMLLAGLLFVASSRRTRTRIA